MVEHIAFTRAAFMFFKEAPKSPALVIKTRTRIRHMTLTLWDKGCCANHEAHAIPTSAP